MENMEYNEAKARIVQASIKLFSSKGYDGTRVNEIADAANVNKALIYYYFKSKEDILDHLIELIIKRVTSITLDFINENVVQTIKKGLLDIKPDRLSFANREAMDLFLEKMYGMHAKLLDYIITHRNLLRILMLESLKDSKHRNVLFKLLNMNTQSEANPIYKTIVDADGDFTYSEDMVLYKFFFGTIPFVAFAAYYDDYKAIRSIEDQELKDSFLRSGRSVIVSLISGNDILLRNDQIPALG